MLIEYEREAIKNLAIMAHKQYKQNLDKTLDLPYFIEELIRLGATENENFQGKNKLYNQKYPRTIRIAPSIADMYVTLLGINNDLIKLDASDASSEEKAKIRQDMIRDAIKPKQVITLEKPLSIWWGDTLKGINLRVGFIKNDRSQNIPFSLGGNEVHMLAGGNTGEGKSVVMNALLTSLLTEYPPWELQLYMNDMKMLEYARYNLSDKCPQIRNIAITGSSTYLISVFKQMEFEMKLMYNLAGFMASNTLEGIRNYLDMYIPRVLCVTDEYSQLPENATSREQMQAEFYIQSIVKLGRAVGYHLILTTQNFKGALPNSTLGQFKVGVCVGANVDNSESIIGNDGAVELTKKIGYCLVNNNRAVGDKANNVEYKVAFIDDKTSKQKQDFQDILKRVCDTAHSVNIFDEPTSFNEKTQTDIVAFSDDFKKISVKADKYIKKKRLLPLVKFCLGDGTRYTGAAETKEFFVWDYSRGSNIFVHAAEIEDIKYLCRLLGKNLDLQRPNEVHRMVIDNTETFSEDYVTHFKKDLTSTFKVQYYLNAALKRDVLLKYNLDAESDGTDTTFMGYLSFYATFKNDSTLKDICENIPILDVDLLYKIHEAEGTEEIINLPSEYQIFKDNSELLSTILTEHNFYKKTMKLKKGKYLRNSDFNPTIFWMFSPQLNEGVIKRGNISNEFYELLTLGPSVGIFFIIVLDNPKDQRQIVLSCKHLVTGNVSPALSNTGLVEFSDTSGICCKYTLCQGEADDCFYFKKYFSNS